MCKKNKPRLSRDAQGVSWSDDEGLKELAGLPILLRLAGFARDQLPLPCVDYAQMIYASCVRP